MWDGGFHSISNRIDLAGWGGVPGFCECLVRGKVLARKKAGWASVAEACR